MDVGKGTEELIDVELDFENRHGGLHLVEISRGAVNCFRDIFLNQVEVYFVLLRISALPYLCESIWGIHTLSPLE